MTEPSPKKAKVWEGGTSSNVLLSLVDLPDLALDTVLHFLSARDVNTLRLVCWRLTQKITNLRSRFRDKWTIDLRHESYPDKYEFFKTSSTNISLILPSKNNFNKTKISLFLDKFHSRLVGLKGQSEILRHIDIDILNKITELTCLSIYCNKDLSSETDLILINSSKLKTLSISNADLQSLIYSQCELIKLQKLELKNCTGCIDISVLFLNSMYNISTLHLDRIDLSSESDVMLQHVQDLRMNQCKIGCSALDSLLSNSSSCLNQILLSNLDMQEQVRSEWKMRKLKKLELDSCKGSEYLRALLTQGSECLEELDVEYLDLSFLLDFDCDMNSLRKVRIVRCSEDYTICNILKKSTQTLQDLELYNLGLSQGETMFSFKILKKLRIQDCVPDEGLCRLLKQSSSCLEELHIFAMHLSALDGLECEMLKLKKIVISDCSLYTSLKVLLKASLGSLEVLLLNYVNLSRFQVNETKLTDLKKLILRHCKGGEGIKNLLRSCNNCLQDLSLSNLKMNHIHYLNIKMSELKRIQIFDCTGKQECLAFLEANFSKLEFLRLHLEYSDFEPADVFEEDINLPSLKQLKIFPVPRDKDLISIRSQLPFGVEIETSYNDGLFM